jgi:hypothetical protein
MEINVDEDLMMARSLWLASIPTLRATATLRLLLKLRHIATKSLCIILRSLPISRLESPRFGVRVQRHFHEVGQNISVSLVLNTLNDFVQEPSFRYEL